MATLVKKCNCIHTQQDRMYGKNNRVHNTLGNSQSFTRGRCTVCENEN